MFIRSGESAQIRRRSATEDHHLTGDVLGGLGDVAQLLGLEVVDGRLLGEAARGDDRALDLVVGGYPLAVRADALAYALDPDAVGRDADRDRMRDVGPAVGVP